MNFGDLMFEHNFFLAQSLRLVMPRRYHRQVLRE